MNASSAWTRRTMLSAALGSGLAMSLPPRLGQAHNGKPLAATPLSRLDLPWWKHRWEEKQRELRQKPVDLVFYGDSITQNWEKIGPEPWQNFAPVWNRYYGHRHAINLGYKGDTTAHLLWRIENGEASGINPRAAVVLIGANNFGKLRWPAEPTLQGIDAIIESLHRHLPKMQILLLGVLPSIRNEWVDAQTVALNRALPGRYDQRVTFLDLRALFMSGGKVDRTRFLDIHLTPPEPPLHPDAATQAAMAQAMEPHIARMLGDTPVR
ncbi:Lipase/Acylhydrolase family protein [Granulibacter bethesdensis]|uniref:GDSL-type esterase/lipase family protein n=1 Tax=Granulibacter bethesdensis TaxID=364410 RepID=UPI00090B7F6C|nr:GDSL-type esterase/lipase family protein [Granulibacter bethesdensis]APH56685.1 Lipase/Acylhydrolase family protein [Granulibacter bethesdensis]